MAKKKRRRKRTTSEKAVMVLGIIIALSMILALFAGLSGGRQDGQAPLPDEYYYVEPLDEDSVGENYQGGWEGGNFSYTEPAS